MTDVDVPTAADVLVPTTYRKVGEEDYSGLFQWNPGFDEGVKAGQQFAAGDWAAGIISLAGSGAELASLALDPFGTLASSVAGFLLDYMPPLPSMLDALAGNPHLVESIGTAWTQVADEMEEAAADLYAAVERVLQSWTGQAAEAYRVVATGMVDLMYKAAYVYRCTGDGMHLASGVVEAVRGLTKEIIADLVGRLIVYAAEVTGTLGLAAPAVIPQACGAIADVVTDASRLARVLKEAMTLGVGSIDEIVDAVNKLLVLLGQVAEGIIQGRDAGEDE
jgi:uncharacterized protein YukE